MSMKTWVKGWLFFLNGVFLLAFAFLEDPAAKWILAAYVASGPLLAWFMVQQRGLTKLLGLAHLLPWIPLLVYLTLRVSSNVAGPLVSVSVAPAFAVYLYVMLACLALCLSLDVWDAVRYLRGERYVLGSFEAARAGASRARPDSEGATGTGVAS